MSLDNGYMSGTNLEAFEGKEIDVNGLEKKSIADCLQTRPIDYRLRLSRIRGRLESHFIHAIDQALESK